MSKGVLKDIMEEIVSIFQELKKKEQTYDYEVPAVVELNTWLKMQYNYTLKKFDEDIEMWFLNGNTIFICKYNLYAKYVYRSSYVWIDYGVIWPEHKIELTSISKKQKESQMSISALKVPEPKKASIIGRTVTGMALGGTSGAVIGMASAIEKNEKINSRKSTSQPKSFDFSTTFSYYSIEIQIKSTETGFRSSIEFTSNSKEKLEKDVEKYINNFLNRLKKLQNDENVFIGGCIAEYFSLNNINNFNEVKQIEKESEKVVYINICGGRAVMDTNNFNKIYLKNFINQKKQENIEKYWNKYQEEKKKILDKRLKIENEREQQLLIYNKLKEELLKIQEEKNIKTSSEKEKDVVLKEIEDLRQKRKSLGIFRKEEKIVLQEKIDKQQILIDEIEKRILTEKEEILAKINKDVEPIVEQIKSLEKKFSEFQDEINGIDEYLNKVKLNFDELKAIIEVV